MRRCLCRTGKQNAGSGHVTLSHGTSRKYAEGCRCDPCRNKQNTRTARWGAQNPDKVKAYSAVYSARHPGRRAATVAKSRIKHLEKRRAEDRTRYYRDVDVTRARNREGYAQSAEKRRAYTREWTAKHPNYRNEWRLANMERVRATDRAAHFRRRGHPERARPGMPGWDAPEWMRVYAERSPKFTSKQWLLTLDMFSHACVYCHRSDVPLEMDHAWPTSRGGPSVRWNIQPVCRSCNARKNALTDEEYRIRVLTQWEAAQWGVVAV